jgi:hypothetical protein
MDAVITILEAAVALARALDDTTVHGFALAVLGISLWLADDLDKYPPP